MTRSCSTGSLVDAVPDACRICLALRTSHRDRRCDTRERVSSRAGRVGVKAPEAEFGGVEFYPDLFDKAAVLTCRLAWNHALVDGNKRAAWAALVVFLDLNDAVWAPDPPSVDEGEEAMLAVAAHEVDELWFAAWLRERASPPRNLTRVRSSSRSSRRCPRNRSPAPCAEKEV